MTVTRADRARVLLTEMGRADLAARVGTNKQGDPIRPPEALGWEEAVLVSRSFATVHGEATTSTYWQTVTDKLREPSPRHLALHWSPVRRRWVDHYHPLEWIS